MTVRPVGGRKRFFDGEENSKKKNFASMSFAEPSLRVTGTVVNFNYENKIAQCQYLIIL